MHLSSRKFGCTFLAAVASLVTIHSSTPVFAAPTKAAAKSTPQSKRAKQVTDALYRHLKGRFSSPGGKMHLTIKPGSRADLGHFSLISVGGKPAKVRKLRISEVAMKASNVRINVSELLRNNELVTLQSNTKLRAVVSENDLTTLLSQGKHTKDMGLRVRYVGDRMHVTGNFRLGWFSGPISGVGKLRLGADNKVFFDILSLKLNGAEAPQPVKNKFSEKINPVIDYNDIPFRPRFKSLKFKGPFAILTA
ncbi:MAG TPA: DUF2993 domain-containing protein [Abditibacteriaceae bacterium]|jgi:hypothetical protein